MYMFSEIKKFFCLLSAFLSAEKININFPSEVTKVFVKKKNNNFFKKKNILYEYFLLKE